MNLLPRPRVVDVGNRRVPVQIVRERIDPSLPAQGYELHIGEDAVELIAADDAGRFYALATLAQLRALHDGDLPIGAVRDHPDLPVRGVMIDVSRDKVPTMATLRALVDRLSSWKINQLQLYSEHTFAYRDHAEVHAAASPFTAEEIRELDAYCRERHIELVPNQNCLGHMNRWLRHDRYRPLALAPDGFVDEWGMTRKAMTIDPANPESLVLVRELLAELLPLFTSRRVHVGLDEAWELPKARMDEFLHWVATLRALPELDGHEMLMWGDMIAGDADRLRQLPEGVTVCEWGYDDWHPFAKRTALLAECEVPFWVAPGTSSWLSIVGRMTNAIGNCRIAAEAALSNGGRGLLNTDWGDQGHLQQLPVSDPGFAYGAAVSWCLDTNADLDLAAALSVHCYDDPSGELAAAVLDLGDAHRVVTPQFPNMSTITLHLYFPQLTLGRGLTRGLTTAELDTVAEVVANARSRADRARSQRPDASALVDEVQWGADVVALLTDDARARLGGDGTIGSVAASSRSELANRLSSLMEQHRALWLQRNRPGGLDDSAEWLANLRRAYESGAPDPDWGGWRVKPDR